jgi:hypothetical protein
MSARHRRLEWDGLEARVAPVGFYQGPALVPIEVALSGVTQGTAATSVHRAETIIRINSGGRVHPVGVSSVAGRLTVQHGFELGQLVLNSPTSRLTLDVAGPAGGALNFTIVNGRGVDPNTTADYVVELGGGRLSVSPTALGRGRVSLTIGG